MHQCECDDIIATENHQSGEENPDNMNTTSTANESVPVIGSQMEEMLKNGESEAPEAEQNCPEASQAQMQPVSVNNKEGAIETESAATVNIQNNPDTVPEKIIHQANQLNRQIKAEPINNANHANRGPPPLEPPPLHPPPAPLQPCHRSIPSNQANIANCITGEFPNSIT